MHCFAAVLPSETRTSQYEEMDRKGRGIADWRERETRHGYMEIAIDTVEACALFELMPVNRILPSFRVIGINSKDGSMRRVEDLQGGGVCTPSRPFSA